MLPTVAAILSATCTEAEHARQGYIGVEHPLLGALDSDRAGLATVLRGLHVAGHEL